MLIVELAIPFTRLVRAKNMVDSTAFSNLSGGQFTPESSGQFDPKWGGQFRPEQVVSLNRIGVVSFTEFSTLTELQQNLESKGIKTYVGRGVAFFDQKSKLKVKGSQIGRGYSLAAIESRIGNPLKMEIRPEVSEKQTQRKRKGLRI